MITKYFEVTDIDEMYEIVRIIGRDCHLIDSDDLCETGYSISKCMLEIIYDHEDFFSNLVDHDEIQWN